ncbi:Rz-like lysis system protein LysB [Paraburkholderia fungorum]|uniref:Rz-like lysis system protein LysB n=1 Tax=Paraburkholderia fungorum TaxID=134537 RepID=UPI0004ABB3EF|nr:Rz-like lysis system protein LysB [Paraburkholderia fungorum]KFX61013.1 protein lysB [Burkholderia sp. K24]USX10521.1 Rz-like lysis system protein LysB [Paraburkholderia fungorum]
MNAIAAKCFAGFIALLLIVAGVLYVRELRAVLADTAHLLDDAKQGIASRDGVIKRLQQDAADKAKQQQQLDTSTNKVEATTAARRQEIRRVISENPIVRTWADTPLPRDIARLQSSPAFTSADDYSSAMSASDAVHAAGNGSEN